MIKSLLKGASTIILSFGGLLGVGWIALEGLSWLLTAEKKELIATWICQTHSLDLFKISWNQGGGRISYPALQFNRKWVSNLSDHKDRLGFPVEPFRQKGWIIKSYSAPENLHQNIHLDSEWNVYLDPDDFSLEDYQALVSCYETYQDHFYPYGYFIKRIIFGKPDPYLEFINLTPRYQSKKFSEAIVIQEVVTLAYDGFWWLSIHFDRPYSGGVDHEIVAQGQILLLEEGGVSLEVKVPKDYLPYEYPIPEDFAAYLGSFKHKTGSSLMDYYEINLIPVEAVSDAEVLGLEADPDPGR
jgi:hypothetical protein